MMSMVVLAMALSLAGGEESVDEARDLFRAGSEAYRQGEYPVAINAFEEALKLAPRPPVIFSLAQAYRLQYFIDGDLSKLGRAVELYRKYLGLVEKGGRRDDASQLLATLAPIWERRSSELAKPKEPPKTNEREKARVIVSSRVEGATARIDGGDAMRIPAAFEVPPGPHRVVVEAAEHQPKTLETVAVIGTAVALNVELDELPGQLAIRAPEGATVHVDGRVLAASAASEPIEVRPGRHLVTVLDRGRDPFIQQVELGRGQSAEVKAELSVTNQRIAAYALLGGSALLFAGGATGAALALDRDASARAIEDKKERTGITVAEANEHTQLGSERDDFARLAAVAAIAGAGAAITGLALWLFDVPEAPTVPVLVPIGTGVAATASF